MTVQTNKITNKQTVNDISTPCLSACVDNKLRYCTETARCAMSVEIYQLLHSCIKLKRFAVGE